MFFKNISGRLLWILDFFQAVYYRNFRNNWNFSRKVYFSNSRAIFRSSRPEVLCKKGVLEISQNSQESTCVRVSFLIKSQVWGCNSTQKETLAYVLSCQFWEISKKIFYYRTPLVAASVFLLFLSRPRHVDESSNNRKHRLYWQSIYASVNITTLRIFLRSFS